MRIEKIWCVGCVVMGLFSSCLTLASEPQANSATKPAVAPDKSKSKGSDVVCKRVKTTSTHFTKRRCHTREDWEEMRREAQEAMQDITNKAGGSSGSSS